MMWMPWKRKTKADPLKDLEASTDDLKKQLHDLRERLLRETIEHAAERAESDDR